MKDSKPKNVVRSLRLSSLDGTKDVTINTAPPTRTWTNVYSKSPAPLADNTKFDDIQERWDRIGIKF